MTEGDHKTDSGNKLARFGMLACCAVMVLPLASFFIAGGALAGSGGGLLLLAPLALCVGAHVFLHRKMGKSCHGSAQQNTGAVSGAGTTLSRRPAIAGE